MTGSAPSLAGGTLIGFDYGLRRIGVAVGERSPPTAAALATCNARDGEADWTALDALFNEWQPALAIVGLPRRDDGSEGTMADGARQFAQAITARYGVAVELIDESFSSRSAREELRHKRRSGMLRRRVKRGDADRIAARLILETWLSAHAVNPSQEL